MRIRLIILALILVGMWLVGCRGESKPTPVATSTPLIIAEEAPLNDEHVEQTDAGKTSNEQVAAVATTVAAQTFDPSITELPASCQPRDGRVQYISLHNRICFTYPEEFALINLDPEKSQLLVSENDDPEGNGAAMFLEITNPAPKDLTLLAAGQAFMAQFPDTGVQMLPAGIGRDQALIFNDVPGESPSRHILAIHEGALYNFSFFPIDSEATERAAIEMKLWQSVVPSFGYLTQGFIDQYAECAPPIADVAPYFDLEGDFCFAYPFSDEAVFRQMPPLAEGLPAGVELNLPASDVRFSITPLQKLGGDSLSEAIAALPEAADLPLIEAAIGAEESPALVVDDVLAGEGVQEGSPMLAFVAHHDTLYRFDITPTDDPVQSATAIRFWSDALASFRFLSDEPEEAAPQSETAEASAGNVPPTDVIIEASDGLQIAGTLYPVEGDGARPAVLLLHMLNSDRSVWAEFAAELNAAGYVALAIDMRGHGATRGGRDWVLAEDDLTLAWRFLADQPNVDAGKIAVIGGSIGANMALILGANQPQIAGVALLSPGLDYRGVVTDAAMTAFGDRPILIVASQEDRYAADSSESLAGLTDQANLIMYDGAGHGTRMFDAEPELMGILIDWLAEIAGG